jgi:hypothetical protein
LIRTLRTVWLLLTLVTITLVHSVFAQTFRGGISGTVTDASGAIVANAHIQLVALATSTTQDTTTTSAGVFQFQDLPLGKYKVTVSFEGFQTTTINEIPVSAGVIYDLPVKLMLAQLSSTIEVSAASLSLDTTTVTQTTVIPQKAVQDIPLNGRDYTQLVALTPGFAGYSASGGVGTGSVNGMRSSQINWQIDGSDNNDLFFNIPALNQGGLGGIAGLVMPMDAIDQFSFVTSSSSETGRSPAGTVNIAIKSGTNKIHGTAYYFNRNEALAAETPFAPAGTPKNEVRSQEDGGSIGGPILKDKSFYFLAFEYQNNVIGNQSSSTEPSAAYQAEAKNLLAYYGVPVNSVSTNLLNTLWPASALTGPASPDNYFNPARQTGYSFNTQIKFDENLNDKNLLSVRIFSAQGLQHGPVGSYLTPYYEMDYHRVHNGAITYNFLPSTRISNQLTAGFSYFNGRFADTNTSYDPVSLGLNTGLTTPEGAPNISLGGNFDPIGVTTPQGRNDMTGHLTDTVSYSIGAHQLRVGGEYRRAQINYYVDPGRGSFTFNGSQGPWSGAGANGTACSALATQNRGTYAPGYAPGQTYDSNVLNLADFLAGCVSSSEITLGNPKRQVFMNTFDIFAQDAWQLTQKLNVNYGVRYDYIGPVHSPTSDLTSFDPTAPNGIGVAGSTIDSLYQPFGKAISPRAGFSYQTSPSIVVHAAFGLYFDTPAVAPFLSEGVSNGGASGVQDNPAGSNPLAQATVSSYVIVPNASIFPSLTQALAGAGVVSLFSVDHGYQPSYSYNYNLNMQMSLSKNVMAQLGYVGTQSRHLTSVADINQAALGSAFAAPTCAPTYASSAQGNQQCSRPYFTAFPQYGVINQIQSRNTSNYNSLQALVRTESWHGLVSQFSYTWSHSLDEDTGFLPYLPQDSTNPMGDYGNSDFDVRNTFTGYVIYDVPAFRHGAEWLTHGWQLNSLLTLHDGTPYTVTADTNASGNGENADRANLVGSPYAGLSHKIQNGTLQWFNPAAFADPPEGQYGTLRRGQFSNPGYEDVDLSVFKNTRITERATTQLRVEMFNLFNRTNLGPVGAPTVHDTSGVIGSTIGTSLGAPGIGPGEPFNTQLALKIIF